MRLKMLLVVSALALGPVALHAQRPREAPTPATGSWDASSRWRAG